MRALCGILLRYNNNIVAMRTDGRQCGGALSYNNTTNDNADDTNYTTDDRRVDDKENIKEKEQCRIVSVFVCVCGAAVQAIIGDGRSQLRKAHHSN